MNEYKEKISLEVRSLRLIPRVCATTSSTSDLKITFFLENYLSKSSICSETRVMVNMR